MADFEDWRLRGDTETDLFTKNESILGRIIRLVFADDGTFKGIKVGKMPGPTLYRDLPIDNAYTDAEKQKLAEIEPGAQVNTVPTFMGREGPAVIQSGDVPLDVVTDTATYARYTQTEKTKLASISPGAGEIFQGNWNASTNTPSLAGTGMTPGFKWLVTTGGTQFSITFTTGHFAIVDTAGVLRDVPSNTFTPGPGQYTTAWVDDSTDRRYVTDAQRTKIVALPAASAPSTHVGAGGTEHAVATTSTAGFMSADDKTFIDMSGLVVSETTPALADGKYWYKPSAGRLHRWDAAASRFWVIAAYSESTAPTVTSDANAGFSIGCIYADTANKWFYVCTNNANGAAVWQRIATPAATSLGGTTLVGAPQSDGSIGLKGIDVAGTTGAPSIDAIASKLTLNIPLRQNGAEIVAAVDGVIGAGWHAGSTSVQTVMVPYLIVGNTVTLTDMPAIETRMFGNNAIHPVDLTSATRIRCSRTIDGTFGPSGAKVYLGYSIDSGSTWTKIDGTDVAIDAGDFVVGSLVSVPDLAKTNQTLVAGYTFGGDGAIDPRIKDFGFEVELPLVTTAGVQSTAFDRVYTFMSGGVGWNAPTPEAEINGHAREPMNLLNVSEIQYSVEITVASTLTLVRQALQYSIDGGTTWTEIDGTQIFFSETGSKLSGWAALPTAARVADAWIRIIGGHVNTSGQTASFYAARVYVRDRTVTPLLTASPAPVWQPIVILHGSPINWTAVPPGTAIEVNTRARGWYDTSRTTAVRFRTYISSAGKAGSVGYIQYSIDLATWTTLDGSSVAVSSTGQKDSGILTIPSAAQNDICWFRFVVDVPSSPAGNTSFGITLTAVYLRTDIFADVPWSAEGAVSGSNFQGPAQTLTASGQAIQSETVFLEGSAAAFVFPPADSGINKCWVYNNRSSPSTGQPSGSEAIDGVGPSGVDVMPYKWLKMMRRASGTPTWFEVA